ARQAPAQLERERAIAAADLEEARVGTQEGLEEAELQTHQLGLGCGVVPAGHRRMVRHAAQEFLVHRGVEAARLGRAEESLGALALDRELLPQLIHRPCLVRGHRVRHGEDASTPAEDARGGRLLGHGLEYRTRAGHTRATAVTLTTPGRMPKMASDASGSGS